MFSDLAAIVSESSSRSILQGIYERMQGKHFHDHACILYDIRTLLGDKRKTYLEIGTYLGASAALMLNHPYPTDVLCVDPLILSMAETGTPRPQEEMVLANLRNLAKQTSWEILKHYSWDKDVISRLYSRGSAIDILFIDGDHSFAGVLMDFMLYEPLVVPGGVIVFDDYADLENSSEVAAAVGYILRHLVESSAYEVVGQIAPNAATSDNNQPGNLFVMRKVVATAGLSEMISSAIQKNDDLICYLAKSRAEKEALRIQMISERERENDVIIDLQAKLRVAKKNNINLLSKTLNSNDSRHNANELLRQFIGIVARLSKF